MSITKQSNRGARRAIAVACLLAALIVVGALPAGTASWTQWGGPDQSFRAPSSGLASSWPDKGPPELWSRELGEGYSGILFEAGRLYTMFRADGREVVASLDAATGKTLWERAYEATPREGHVTQFGEGPRATPLIVGKSLYTIGISGKMHCLDKRSGKVVWSHDLWEDFGGNFLNHGYASSPVAYGKTVIALVGGEGQSIVAFDQASGKVVWKGLDFKNSYSTPKMLKIQGRDQLVTFMASEMIGVDPSNGKLLWQYPIGNQWGQNINMPFLVDGSQLFLSSLNAGSRGLKLAQTPEGTDVEEIWSTRKIQFYFVNSVLDDGYVYGSTGNSGPAFMAAVNARTGEIAWRKRGFARANVVLADDRLIILDEDGKLYLTSATPEDLVVHSQVELLEPRAWTVPTIVNKTLYARDQTRIVALDLG